MRTDSSTVVAQGVFIWLTDKKGAGKDDALAKARRARNRAYTLERFNTQARVALALTVAQNGYPGVMKVAEIPGLPFTREWRELVFIIFFAKVSKMESEIPLSDVTAEIVSAESEKTPEGARNGLAKNKEL